MSSYRSSLGALFAVVTFFVARRFCDGFALPFFVFLVFSFTYLWAFVLRLPELSQSLQVAENLARSQTADKEADTGPEDKPQDEQEEEEEQREVTSIESSGTQKGGASERQVEPCCEEAASVPSTDRAERDSEPSPAAQAEAAAASPGLVPPPASSTDRADPKEMPEPAAQPEAASVESEKKAPKADDDDGWSDAEAEKEDNEEAENDVADLPRAQELRLQGNELFKAGRLHDAREAYSEAIYLMPVAEKKERAVLHSNRAACLQKLSRWEDVVTDCKKAVELDPEYAKAYLRRSTAYEAQNKWHDALEDLKKAIELEPSLRDREARRLPMLEKRSQEQFEKDKDEMMGKLKDLGNTILGKFGMSVDNFKMEQDPDTGSYSIKYQN